MHDHIKEYIRTIPDFPQKGVMFRDITTLIKHPKGLGESVQILIDRYKDREFDLVAGIESRGFIFGAALAVALQKGFVPVRKQGKLPGETVAQTYDLEYGTATIEIHKDAISDGQKVLLVDDLMATGGTMQAACMLVDKLGGRVEECVVIIDLPALKGREKIKGYSFFRMIAFEGE